MKENKSFKVEELLRINFKIGKYEAVEIIADKDFINKGMGYLSKPNNIGYFNHRIVFYGKELKAPKKEVKKLFDYYLNAYKEHIHNQ